MPKGMWKQCKYPGCSGLTHKRYCDKHSYLEEKDKKERMDYYNRLVRDKGMQAFYDSPAWRKLRRQKLNQSPLCELCLKNGSFTAAVICDHIIEIKDGGAALDIANLQSTCRCCHNKKTISERQKRNKNGGTDN